MQPHSGSLVWRWRGLKMLGVAHRPALRPGRRAPAVLFLHGFPGSEKNVDVQRWLMDRGVASFAPHFAGAWGSGGRYGFATLVDQARAALKVLAAQDAVDARRLAVFGFSMGGWTALNLAARAPGLKAVAAVAPVGGAEMLGPDARSMIVRLAKPLAAPAAGPLFADFAASVRRQDPAAAVAKPGCPLLLVHGTEDHVVPFGVGRRLAAAAGARAKFVVARGADHAYLDRRPWLARLTGSWLLGRLRA
jgi:dipeptidyl aminopeptidase/acylaminoacyl peptidase